MMNNPIAGQPGKELVHSKNGRGPRRWMNIGRAATAVPDAPQWDENGWMANGTHRKTGTSLNPDGVPRDYDQVARPEGSELSDVDLARLYRAGIKAEHAAEVHDSFIVTLIEEGARDGEAPDWTRIHRFTDSLAMWESGEAMWEPPYKSEEEALRVLRREESAPREYLDLARSMRVSDADARKLWGEREDLTMEDALFLMIPSRLPTTEENDALRGEAYDQKLLRGLALIDRPWAENQSEYGRKSEEDRRRLRDCVTWERADSAGHLETRGECVNEFEDGTATLRNWRLEPNIASLVLANEYDKLPTLICTRQELVDAVQKHGFDVVSVREEVGATPEYVEFSKAALEAGVYTPAERRRLFNAGVTPEYIGALHENGVTEPDAWLTAHESGLPIEYAVSMFAGGSE